MTDCRPLDCRRKELDVSLLNGDVDCCVHSMKDVPTWLVPGTILPCTLPREDTRDAWISPSGKLPQDLPDGAAACRHQEPGPLQERPPTPVHPWPWPRPYPWWRRGWRKPVPP